MRFILSSLSYCLLYGHNIAFFLLGFHFYGSGIFTVPMGFVSDIEEAKIWCSAVLITVISMFVPLPSGDVVKVQLWLVSLVIYRRPCGYDAQPIT